MKNYFIANREVLDTTMTIEEIESAVNDSLEETTGGMVSFAIEELSCIFRRIPVQHFR